jgi:hypothetical protein
VANNSKKIGELAVEAKLELGKLESQGAKGTKTLRDLLEAAVKLDKGLSPTEKSIQRTTDRLTALSATKAQQKMVELSAGVEKAGGVFTKTAAQVEFLRKRIESLQAAGAKQTDFLKGLNLGGGNKLGQLITAETSAQAATLTSRLGPLSSILSGIGPAGLVAGASIGAVIIAGKGLVDLTVNTAKWANEINDSAAAMGATTEEAQRLRFAALSGGQSFEALQGSVVHMRKALVDAPDDFVRMGLSVQKLRSMNTTELFTTVGRAIDGIKDKNLQADFAMNIFGKSWREIAPIINGGLDAMKNAPVVADATIQKLDAQNARLNVLSEAWSALWRELGTGIAASDSTTKTIDAVTSALGKLAGFIKDNPDLITKALRVSALVGTLGLSEVGIAAARFLPKAAPAPTSYMSRPGAPQYPAGHVDNGGGGETVIGASAEEKKALAAADDAIAAAREKGLPPLVQEIDAIDRATAAKLREIEASNHSVAVKAQEREKAIALAAAQKEGALQAEVLAAETKGVAYAFDQAAQKRDLYEQALGAFGADDAEIATRMGALADNIERVQHGFANMNTSQIESFRKQLTDLATAGGNAPGKMGPLSDETFKALKKSGDELHAQLVDQGDAVESTGGKWMRVAVAAQEAQDATDEGVKKINEHLSEQVARLAAIAQGFEDAGQAVDALSGVLQTLGMNSNSKGGKALSGAEQWLGGASEMAAGLASGNVAKVITGGLHELAGQINVVKAIFGGKSEQQKIGEELGRTIGEKLPDGIAKAIEDSEKTGGKDGGKITRAIAEALHAGDILESAGINAGTASILGDLLNAWHDGLVNTKDAAEQTAKAFTQMKTAAEGGDAKAQAAMVGLIRRAKELKLEIPEIDAAMKEWAKNEQKSLGDFIKGQNAKFTGKDGELAGGQVSAEQAKANDIIFGAVEKANIAFEGLVQAAEDSKEALDGLQKSLPPGSKLSETTTRLLQANSALANSPLFKGAATTGKAAGDILGNMVNRGEVSQEVAGAFGTTLVNNNAQALEGLKGQGLTEDEQRKLAEEANLPLLMQMQHAQEQGATFSPEAQAILDQASIDGILPLKDINEQQLDVLKQIRDGVKGGGGNATPRGSAPSTGAGGGTGGSDHPHASGPPDHPTHAAQGGYFPAVPGGHYVNLAEAGKGEWVVNEDQMAGLMAQANYDIPRAENGLRMNSGGIGRPRGSSSSSNFTVGGITVNAQPGQSPQEIAREVVRELARNSPAGSDLKTQIQKIARGR